MLPLLKKKSLWVGLVSFLVLAWAAQTSYLSLSQKQSEQSYETLREGDHFPETMPLLGAEGKFASFSEFKGKVVLFNFWAAWCGPCLTEMPSLYALQNKFSEKGFVVLGVSMDENLAQGLAALKRVAGDAPFAHFRGPEQAIAARFPIEGLPFTVVVDKQGKILYARAGERNWADADAIKFIEGLL